MVEAGRNALGGELCMAELTLQTIILLVVLAAVLAWFIKLFLSVRKTINKNLSTAEGKMQQLEQEYDRLNKDLQEMNSELSTKVDFEHLDKKISELVAIATKSRKPARARAKVVKKKAARKKKK